MKRTYLLLCLLLISTFAFAQENNRGQDDERWEKLQQARIAFLTNRLQLDSKTAQQFWPIFNAFDDAKRAMHKKYSDQKRNLVNGRGYDNLTNDNAEQMVDVYLNQKQDELDLEKKYLEKFKAVLEPKAVWMVIRIDSDFRRSLMRRFGDERDKKDRRDEK